MIDQVILYVLPLAIVPLVLSIFYYVTKPSGRWWRVPSRAWINTIGLQVVAQKAVLLALLGFILLSRFNPDLPGRPLIAYTLYFLLVIVLWWFFIIQRRVQLPHERAQRQPPTEGDNP